MTNSQPRRPRGVPTRRSRRAAARAERRTVPPPRRTSGPPLGLIATVGAIVAGVALVAVIALSQGLGRGGLTPTATANADPNASLVAPSFTIPGNLGDTPAQLGNPSAPITIEITEDYQCPICGMFSREELPRLVQDFVAPGLARIVVHDVAYLDYTGTESLDAATAAACAGEQGRYWEYHDWLYANQHGERQGAFAGPRLDAIAAAIDLDKPAFDACLSGPTEKGKVKATTNTQLAVTNVTPTFVINGGQPIKGLPQYEQLASYLRSLLPSGATGVPSASG